MSTTAAMPSKERRERSCIMNPQKLCVRHGPRGAKTAAAAFGRIELARFNQNRQRHRRDDQLGDPHAMANDKRIDAQIDQQDHYFTAIIGVYRSGSIQNGNSAFY